MFMLPAGGLKHEGASRPSRLNRDSVAIDAIQRQQRAALGQRQHLMQGVSGAPVTASAIRESGGGGGGGGGRGGGGIGGERGSGGGDGGGGGRGGAFQGFETSPFAGSPVDSVLDRVSDDEQVPLSPFRPGLLIASRLRRSFRLQRTRNPVASSLHPQVSEIYMTHTLQRCDITLLRFPFRKVLDNPEPTARQASWIQLNPQHARDR